MKEEINLENPIFTFYVKVGGLSRQSAQQAIAEMENMVSIYSNITCWIIPIESGDSRVECVYDGKSKIRNEELSKLITEINKRVDILSNSSNFDEFKMNIRDWKLGEFLDETI